MSKKKWNGGPKLRKKINKGTEKSIFKIGGSKLRIFFKIVGSKVHLNKHNNIWINALHLAKIYILQKKYYS